jgi:AcrR family transcriptional regulator
MFRARSGVCVVEVSECVLSTEGSLMDEKGPDKPRTWKRAGLPRERRREQILRSAERLFAGTGLRSTTTAALAKAARISEAILYRHFGVKQKLFEKVVEHNTQQRLAGLEGRFSLIPTSRPSSVSIAWLKRQYWRVPMARALPQ